jgi:hypothetical protein
MPNWNLPLTGRCRCEQVRFEVTAAPLMTTACHCIGCQRLTGGPFSLGAIVPRAGFAITAGVPVIGALHGPSHYYFCPHCMSWLYTQPEQIPDVVVIRSTMLDDRRGLAPFIETKTSERLPWATTPAVHSFEHWPPPEALGPLIGEFANWEGRIALG